MIVLRLMRRFALGMTVLTALLSPGCAGTTAEAPLTIKLGTPREQAISELKAHKFCHTADGPAHQKETYPRCERAGTEWGDSWVTASYDEKGALLELKRFERYSDDNHAVERWNQLVGDRMKVSPNAEDAGDALRARGPLEAGTRSVKAFLVDNDTIVAVYLLTPTPPERASVLEAVVKARR